MASISPEVAATAASPKESRRKTALQVNVGVVDNESLKSSAMVEVQQVGKHAREIFEIDGNWLRNMLLAGCQNLLNNKGYLNKINVFPVPDGDTGTNMACCFNGIFKALMKSQSDHLSETTSTVINAAIMSARGNSGTILSCFFNNLHKHVNGRPKLSTKEFVDVVLNVGKAMQFALGPDTKAGTMPWVAYASTLTLSWDELEKNGQHNLHDVMAVWRSEADSALARTPEFLEVNGVKVLKKHNVVDSGAQGLVYVIQGMHEACAGKAIEKAVAEEEDDDMELKLDEEEVDPKYRYCTEFVVELNNKDLAAPDMKAMFTDLGESIVPLIADKFGKIHIHTNDPSSVFRKAATLGNVKKRKVEDMRSQAGSVASEGWKNPKMRLLMDSTTDLPPELIQKTGVAMCSVRVFLQGSNPDGFRDKVDLQSDEFYDIISREDPMAKTAGVPTGEWKAAIEKSFKSLPEDGEVLIVTISQKLSAGTWSSLQAAIGMIKDNDPNMASRIHVFDSQAISTAAGHFIVKAVELANKLLPAAQVVKELESARSRVECAYMLDTMIQLKRSGRVSGLAFCFADCLKVKPILTLENGGLITLDKAFSVDSARSSMLAHIGDTVPANSDVYVHLAHTGRPDLLTNLEESLSAVLAKKSSKIKSVLCMCVGPALGVHAGPGCWGLSIYFEPSSA